MPRVAVFRSFVLNHAVHHRGQLSVYLRLLDVPHSEHLRTDGGYAELISMSRRKTQRREDGKQALDLLFLY